jgi:tRNA (adenine22-N1)-methyltransferase
VSVPLGTRLRSAASLVPATCAALADVGAGHGRLAAGLALAGTTHVIATELPGAPLAELRRNLAAWGLEDRVEVRCGVGLDPLARGEVDVVVVAGVGAATALRIARDAPERGVRWLVLQCMQRDHLVEPWLSEHGWPIRASEVCVQRGRSYVARLVEVLA